MIEAYPLKWPIGWPRNQEPEHSRFQSNSVYSEGKDIVRQLNLMGASDIIINSNMMLRSDGIPYARQNVSDTGVCVYFTLNGNPQCIPCDKWVTLEDNMRAIAKTIDALRGIERWGAKEMVDAAFMGFKALPEPSRQPAETWYSILDVPSIARKEQIKSAFMQKAHIHHPDKGGDPEMFHKITKAYEEGMSLWPI